jgi:cytochrome b561
MKPRSKNSITIKILNFLIGFLIILNIFTGILGASLLNLDQNKMVLFNFHTTLGILCFVLLIEKILLLHFSKNKDSSLKKWKAIFYCFIFIIIISGYLGGNLNGNTIAFFDYSLPLLFPASDIFKIIHACATYGLIFAAISYILFIIFLHIKKIKYKKNLYSSNIF